MLPSVAEFLSSDRFMPHGMCFLWEPWLLWLHALSDGLIALGYYAIPLAIGYLAWRRRDLVFRHLFILSALFVLACGTTHIMGIWVIWNPDYGVEGLIKAATATISLISLIAMWQAMPNALALPSPAQLRQMNDALTLEVEERARAETEVRRLNEALQREVSERRRAEEALRAIIEGSPQPIISLDREGELMLWNPAAEETFGYSAQEAGGNGRLALPAAERAGFETLFQRAIGGEPLRDVELACRRKDGKEIEISLAGAPLRDPAGRVQGVTFVAEDVTEKRFTERQLAQAQKMEAIGQLTGGLAHDFNNLLTVVVGNLELLGKGQEPGSRPAMLTEAALQAALAGGQLTRQLLAFARRQALKPKAIDLNELVSGTTALLRHTIGEQIEVSLKLSERLWPALADPSQLESALANLAINARDAMPDGGRLSIETSNVELDEGYAAENLDASPGAYVMLAVTDSGSGIPTDALPHVFEPFFTTKPTGTGSGLGLSMVYGFAKQSGGHVKIYSEPGHGTTLRLYLPRARGGVGPPVPLPADGDIPASGGETILVVEDDAAVRRVAVARLSDLGYRVIEAPSGASALRILEESEQQVDLLFTDLVMSGGMSGGELARRAQALVPGLKLLFTSGFAEQAGLRVNAPPDSEHLSKPYLKRDLARKLHRILRG